MVKYCAHGKCNSDSTRNPNVKFIPFIKPDYDKKRCERWLHLCGRSKENFSLKHVNRNTYVCQKHFKESDDLDWRKNLQLEPSPVTNTENLPKERKSNISTKGLESLRNPDTDYFDENLAKHALSNYSRSLIRNSKTIEYLPSNTSSSLIDLPPIDNIEKVRISLVANVFTQSLEQLSGNIIKANYKHSFV